jgi:hypothetical protein
MNTRESLLGWFCSGMALVFTGCATTPPPDYTNFRQNLPKSILVLPPLNRSTAVEATYGYLSTVTMPVAEMGYYVYPVAIVDGLLKENGLPTADDMHQAPLAKLREVIGADAVLYLAVEEYGTKYQVINSATVVRAKGRLVDARTGSLLWEGEAQAVEGSAGSGNLIGDMVAAAVTQVLNSSTDHAHKVARQANQMLFAFKGRGLLFGPRHPKTGSD